MEGDVAGETWGPPHIMLTGWAEWDMMMVTMMDSASARRMLTDILNGLPTHRRALIDEEATLSDLGVRGRHMKNTIRKTLKCAMDKLVVGQLTAECLLKGPSRRRLVIWRGALPRGVELKAPLSVSWR